MRRDRRPRSGRVPPRAAASTGRSSHHTRRAMPPGRASARRRGRSPHPPTAAGDHGAPRRAPAPRSRAGRCSTRCVGKPERGSKRRPPGCRRLARRAPPVRGWSRSRSDSPRPGCRRVSGARRAPGRAMRRPLGPVRRASWHPRRRTARGTAHRYRSRPGGRRPGVPRSTGRRRLPSIRFRRDEGGLVALDAARRSSSLGLARSADEAGGGRCRDDGRAGEVAGRSGRPHAPLEIPVRCADADLAVLEQSRAQADARSAPRRKRDRAGRRGASPKPRSRSRRARPRARGGDVQPHAAVDPAPRRRRRRLRGRTGARWRTTRGTPSYGERRPESSARRGPRERACRGRTPWGTPRPGSGGSSTRRRRRAPRGLPRTGPRQRPIRWRGWPS